MTNFLLVVAMIALLVRMRLLLMVQLRMMKANGRGKGGKEGGEMKTGARRGREEGTPRKILSAGGLSRTPELGFLCVYSGYERDEGAE